MRKTITIIVTVLFVLMVFLPFAGFVVLKKFLVTSDYIVQAIEKEVAQHTNLKFSCDNVELSFIDSWPEISLSVSYGKLSLPAADDSVSACFPLQVNFCKLYGTLDAIELIKNRRFVVEGLEAKGIHTDYVTGVKLAPVLKKKDTGSEPLFTACINTIDISDASFSVFNREDSLILLSKGVSVSVEGNLVSKTPDFFLKLEADSLIAGNTMMPVNSCEVQFEGQGFASENFSRLKFDDASATVNNIPFKCGFVLSDLSYGKIPSVDMNFSLAALDVEELMEYMPESVVSALRDYEVKGQTELDGHVCGLLSVDSIPAVNVKGTVSDAALKKKGAAHGIEDVNMKLEIAVLPDSPDSSFVRLDNVRAKGLDSNVSFDCNITNILTKPFVTADVKGHINAGSLASSLLPAEVAVMKGDVTADMYLAFNLEDMKALRWNRIWVAGETEVKDFECESRKYDVNVISREAGMKFGYKKNKSDFLKGDEVVNGLISADKVSISYKDKMSFKLEGLDMRTGTTVPGKDLGGNMPVTVHAECNNAQIKVDETKWMSLEDVELHAGIKESDAYKGRDEGGIVFKSVRLKYIDNKKRTAIISDNCSFLAEMRPVNNAGAPIDMLRNWDVKGVMNFDEAQAYVSFFPKKTIMKDAQVSFRNNQLSVNRLALKAGQSDMLISGMMYTNLRQSDNKRFYEGTMQILAGSVNFNELQKILANGMDSENVSDKIVFTLDNLESEMNSNKPEAKEKHIPLYVPGNIDFTVRADIDNFNYNDVELQNFKGDILLKGQKAKVNGSTRTNLGKIRFDMLYDCTRKASLNAYYDIELNDVLMGQIHKVLPVIADNLPVLKSVDGLADCSLTGSSTFKSGKMPALETTKAVCSISGTNLQLVDNKTFREIAKKFRFKDREHNNIDYISADIVLANKTITILPFVMKWDRYEAIIGGQQSLDFEYDYHIDILKSPIPIDFGVNITGKGNEPKYKVGKCKYKKMFSGSSDVRDKSIRKTKQLREAVKKQLAF